MLVELEQFDDPLIVVGSGPNSDKYRLVAHDLGQHRVKTARPHRVPETVFNDAFTDPLYNAVLKAIQQSRNPARLQGIFGSKMHQFKGETYDVTNDVLLCAYDPYSNSFIPYNKPAEDWNKEQIRSQLWSIFGIPRIDGYVHTLLRTGEAAFNAARLRGIAGTIDTHILTRPISPEELDLFIFGRDEALVRGNMAAVNLFNRMYEAGEIPLDQEKMLVDGMSRKDLRLTNAGWRWDHPIGRRIILDIDGVSTSDLRYAWQWTIFERRFKGAPIEKLDLLRTAAQFAHGNAYGNLTDEVVRAVGMFPQFKNIEIGSWLLWHPRKTS